MSTVTYTIRHPADGRAHRYENNQPSPDAWHRAAEAWQLVNMKFPKLAALVAEDHFLQEWLCDYDGALFGGSWNPRPQAELILLLLAERAS